VAELVVRLLATAALWVRIQTSLKIQIGRHKQTSGHTLPAKKKYKQKLKQKPATAFIFSK
jgi:hypothetical protein